MREELGGDVMREAIAIILSTHIYVRDKVRHLVVHQQIVIDRGVVRRRPDVEKKRRITRYKDAMQLIENFCSFWTDEHGVHFNCRTAGNDNALFDMWWTFTEWIDAYSNYGLIPRIEIGSKENQTCKVSDWYPLQVGQIVAEFELLKWVSFGRNGVVPSNGSRRSFRRGLITHRKWSALIAATPSSTLYGKHFQPHILYLTSGI